MTDLQKVEDFYEQNAQKEWERLEQFRMEFAVTLRAFHDHLPGPPADVLDIGGGPGRYAIALTQQGYRVTLVDLSRENVKLAGQKAAESGVALQEAFQGDARDLTRFPDVSFDVVLLLGPLYHLLEERDRRRAICAAERVLRSGGTIAAAFLGRYTPMIAWARVWPDILVTQADRVERQLESGVLTFGPDGDFTESYWAHPNEIRPLFETDGFETVTVIAVDGVAAAVEARFADISADLWDRWVEMNYRLGKDPSVHGVAGHLLYIGKKK